MEKPKWQIGGNPSLKDMRDREYLKIRLDNMFDAYLEGEITKEPDLYPRPLIIPGSSKWIARIFFGIGEERKLLWTSCPAGRTSQENCLEAKRHIQDRLVDYATHILEAVSHVVMCERHG